MAFAQEYGTAHWRVKANYLGRWMDTSLGNHQMRPSPAPPGRGRQAAAVFLGGSAGALARYGIGLHISAVGEIPLATMAANLSGSTILGFLAGMALAREGRGIGWALWGVGFSGAFTTFSTFAFEALRLMERQGPLTAALYAVASVLGGLLVATAARRRGLKW